MNSYTVTTGNGKQVTVNANSAKRAMFTALEQLEAYELPVTAETATGTGERLVMPDVSKGRLL